MDGSSRWIAVAPDEGKERRGGKRLAGDASEFAGGLTLGCSIVFNESFTGGIQNLLSPSPDVSLICLLEEPRLRYARMPLAALNDDMVVTSVRSCSFFGTSLSASQDPVDVGGEGFESPDFVDFR